MVHDEEDEEDEIFYGGRGRGRRARVVQSDQETVESDDDMCAPLLRSHHIPHSLISNHSARIAFEDEHEDDNDDWDA